jgi:hypothetical protein
MTKPRRKEIKLTKDSILGLMQEIYNELVEQRNTAIRLQNKMSSLMKDADDLTILGPIIKEQQKIINDTIEKKLSLSKLQSQIWEKSNNNSEESFSLNEIDDDVLQNLIGKDIDKLDDGKYHLK